MKKTVSLKDVKTKTNSKAEKIYPIISFKENGDEHKTVALKLNKEQAIDLATNILVGAKNGMKCILQHLEIHTLLP